MAQKTIFPYTTLSFSDSMKNTLEQKTLDSLELVKSDWVM